MRIQIHNYSDCHYDFFQLQIMPLIAATLSKAAGVAAFQTVEKSIYMPTGFRREISICTRPPDPVRLG